MKTLIIVTGISDGGYGMNSLIKSGLYDLAKHHYNKIVEIDYQPIMDRHAMCFKTLGDPLRFMLSPKSHEVVQFITQEINKYKYHDIDLITHSLGGWVLEEVPCRVNNWYSIASATGWFLPFGQMMIKLRIGEPKCLFNKRYWLFSNKDVVSSRPPTGDKKFNNNTEFIETGLPHDLVLNLQHNIFMKRFMLGK